MARSAGGVILGATIRPHVAALVRSTAGAAVIRAFPMILIHLSRYRLKHVLFPNLNGKLGSGDLAAALFLARMGFVCTNVVAIVC